MKLWRYLFNNAPMFVFLTAISIVIGVLFNWALLVDISTNENASEHWTIIFFDLTYFTTEVGKIALTFATILNLTYYGTKSIFRPLKIE
ncbi:hypothetical protein AB1K89_03480 [Sporosarcina sp. 179-K 8C2 HS]|uniref:hypothetical protein n=1 Tax=Sporosarcina sp. 179-K 8C2 HS TaxID=3142387 RepID=UPI0039A2137F